MFADYSSWRAGSRARLYQARATKKLGDIPQALALLKEDLIDVSPDRDLPARKLRVQVILLAIECWMDDSQKKFVEAIALGMPWLDGIQLSEHEDPDWMLLRLVLAQVHRQYFDELRAKNPRDPQVKIARETARKLARAVARVPGEYQETARTLLAELPSGIGTSAQANAVAPPENFEEAKTRGN